MGNIVSVIYDAYNDSFDIAYKSISNLKPCRIIIQRYDICEIYMNGNRTSWQVFRDIFKDDPDWSKNVTCFCVNRNFSGIMIGFIYKEENNMAKYKTRAELEAEVIELRNALVSMEVKRLKADEKRQYWIRKYESEHERANSLDKKYNIAKDRVNRLAEAVTDANKRVEAAETSFKAMRVKCRKLIESAVPSDEYDSYKKGWNEARDAHKAEYDDVIDQIRDIWAICCYCDIEDSEGLPADKLLADIFEYCDRAHEYINKNRHNFNKAEIYLDYIQGLYDSICGDDDKFRNAEEMMEEIIKHLETWQKDRDKEIYNLKCSLEETKRSVRCWTNRCDSLERKLRDVRSIIEK